MKKTLALMLLTTLLALSLAACSSGVVRKTTPATEAPAATSTAQATATPGATAAATVTPTDAPAEVESTELPAN